MSQKVLVTGGAGYIGSHVVQQLGEAGYEVIVYDNLSTGFPWAVLSGSLIVGDLSDQGKLDEVFSEHQFDAVLHFAANIVVPESVSDPLKYYRNNTANTLSLIETCKRYDVNKFVFSSTAAVYGIPDCESVTETNHLSPINPYGFSKMMSEQILMDYAAVSNLNYVILRYFNVAGADHHGRLGQAMPEATHLIKVACEAALGKRSGMEIFGNDYKTPDGTCVRDYIHVEDLASAHLDALTYLNKNNDSVTLNCGYGHGFSVKEVIDTVKNISGKDFPVTQSGRRAGDPPCLIADNAKIKAILGWQPRYADIDTIVKTAFSWEAKLAEFLEK